MFHARWHDTPDDRINEIVIDFADPGSITVEFLAKVPGPELTLGHATMMFSYKDSFAAANALEGYERLILLAMVGDQSLFTRSTGSSGCGRSPSRCCRTRRPSSSTNPVRGVRPRSTSSSRRTAGASGQLGRRRDRGMPVVAFVVNRTLLRDPRRFLGRSRQAADERGWKPCFMPTSAVEDGGALTRRAVAAGASLVFAAGGDGTVRACAEALAGADVPLAIVPLGAANLTARALGVPGPG